MELNARPFRCLVAIVEQGSFRRAATKLNISQPALSAQIRELERRLGFALFERDARPVRLTSQGHLFLPNARRLIIETEVANRAAADIRNNQLRIATPLLTALIPARVALIEQFSRMHPAVPLRILEEDHARALAALKAEEADLALLLMPAPASTGWRDDGVPRSMEWLPLATRASALRLPSDHDLATGPLNVGRLLGQLVARLGRSHGRPLSDAIADRLEAVGARPVRPPEGHALAVERYAEFAGMAAVSLRWLPEEIVAAPRTIVRDVEGLGLASCLALVRNRGRQRPAAEAFAIAATSMLPSHPALGTVQEIDREPM